MSVQLGPGAPTNSGEAFLYVRRLRDEGANVDDLKVLALAEAIGLELYEDLARKTDNPEAQALLRQSGREEMIHAHRISQVIEILSGEAFPIPAIEDHPFYTPMDTGPLTREALEKLAQGEFAGEDLYKGVASRIDHPEALKLLAQNGKEELDHGARIQKVVALLFG